jgi:gamma-glutamylcyclotransferase (GGCT)/AIG2-like uncharacterized protein YtfP
MATSELRAVCAGAEPLGPARLDDHRLAFLRRSRRWGAGAADIVAAPGQTVWGVLYAIPAEELSALDAREGLGVAYDRFEVEVSLAGSARRAFAYLGMEPEPRELAPDPRYLELMLAGAREHRLPRHYVSRITTRLREVG